MKEQAAKLKEM